MPLITENIIPVDRRFLVAIFAIVAAACAIINVIMALLITTIACRFWHPRLAAIRDEHSTLGTTVSVVFFFKLGEVVVIADRNFIACHASSVFVGASLPSWFWLLAYNSLTYAPINHIGKTINLS